MRREHGVLAGEKIGMNFRLVFEYVESRRGDPFLCSARAQSGPVDNWTASGIHQDSLGLHQAQLAFADQVPRT